MSRKTSGYFKLEAEINTAGTGEYICIYNCSLRASKVGVSPRKAKLAITQELIRTSDSLMSVSGVLALEEHTKDKVRSFPFKETIKLMRIVSPSSLPLPESCKK